MREHRTILIALGLVCLLVIVTSYLYYLERRHQEAVIEADRQMLDVESSVLAARSSGDLEVKLYFYQPAVILAHLDLLMSRDLTTPTDPASSGELIMPQELMTSEDLIPSENRTFSEDLTFSENLLISETRSIFRTEDTILTARQIIHEVMKGPAEEDLRIFSERARLRQVYLLEDGTALVDLSREILHPLMHGIAVELSALYSITRSLTENIDEIKRIRFLVEGEERPTLAGHVSIRDLFM